MDSTSTNGVQADATVEFLVEGILRGDFDEHLSRLTSACATRKSVVAELDAARLQPGDRVVSGNKVRPTYLQRAVGTYLGPDGNRLSVRFDDDSYDHRVAGKTWRMSKGSVRRLEEIEEVTPA